MPCPSLVQLEKAALEVQRTVDELFTCSEKRVLCLSKSSFKLQPQDFPGSSTESAMLLGTPQSRGRRHGLSLPRGDVYETIILQGHLRMTSSLMFLAGLRSVFSSFSLQASAGFLILLRRTDRSYLQGCVHWKGHAPICWLVASGIHMQCLDHILGRKGRVLVIHTSSPHSLFFLACCVLSKPSHSNC